MSYAGKVPCSYDKNSRQFNEGAQRHWPSFKHHRDKLEQIDRSLLGLRDRKGHQFTEPRSA